MVKKYDRKIKTKLMKLTIYSFDDIFQNFLII